MANGFTQSIKPSGQGGDFTTLDAWESQNLNLVALDSQSYAYIDGDWSGSAITTQFYPYGWTTDETHDVTIETSPSCRHPGYFDYTKFLIEISNDGIPIYLRNDNITINGFQIIGNYSGNCYVIAIAGNKSKSINTIGKLGPNATPYRGFSSPSTSTYTSSYINCISVGSNYGFYGQGSKNLYYNCIAVDCTYGYRSNNNSEAINCVSLNTTNDIYSTTDFLIDHLASDDGDGTNPITPTDWSAIFENTASYDFRFKTWNHELNDAGANLVSVGSSSINTAIDGAVRYGNWDIGPFKSPAVPVTQSIKPSGQGGDFTSATAWEAQNLNLVALDSQSYAYIDGDWSGYQDSRWTFTGWTVDSDHTIVMETSPSARHRGVWDDTKYTLYTIDGRGVTGYDSRYLTLKGLQIWISASADYTSQVFGVLAHGSILENNIIRGDVKDNTTSGYKVGIYIDTSYPNFIQNCIIYGFSNVSTPVSDGIRQRGTGGTKVYNTLIFDCSVGFDESSGTLSCINCIAQNCTDGFYSAIGDYNISDIASDAPGSNSQTGTVSFVDSASYNFNLASDDTLAIDHGVDLVSVGSSSISTDIIGTDRGVSWDVGPFEYIGSGPTPPVTLKTFEMYGFFFP